MIRAVPVTLLVSICYMSAAILLASWQKTVSNTMLCIGSILIILYFTMRIFDTSFFLFSWIPFFYLYPLDIAAQAYAADSITCTLICLLWVPVLFAYTIHMINRSDLEGGMR